MVFYTLKWIFWNTLFFVNNSAGILKIERKIHCGSYVALLGLAQKANQKKKKNYD
jgi:hypothetical protein